MKISEADEMFVTMLRRVRRARGMTQQNLADETGIPRGVIGKIESSTRGLLLGEAVAIAEALGVPLADMVKGRVTIRVQTVVVEA